MMFRSFFHWIVLCAGASMAVTWHAEPRAAIGQEGPRFIIDELGLTDAIHTRNDGYREASLRDTTTTGYATGLSYRWDRDSRAGYSAWLYDSDTGKSHRIGLIDPEGGERWSSSPRFLNRQGQVAGTANWNSSPSGIMWSWFYDHTTKTQTQLGFLGEEYTRTDGSQYTEVEALTDSGHAFGRSLRFEGNTSLGRSIWAFDSSRGTTTRIGFFDGTDFTHPVNGEQTSSFAMASSRGFATGTSSRFTEEHGRSWVAWSYDPTTSEVRRIGMNDPDTGGLWAGGNDDVLGVTENRVVIGTYAYDDWQAAWVNNDAKNTTTRTGLFDDEHTAASGRQVTDRRYTEWNSEGQVIGKSRRYSRPGSNSSTGWSAWLFNPDTDTTTRLGFTDSEHTRSSDQYQHNWTSAINELGLVIGGADRWDGENTNGRTAWLYNPSDDTTTKLGDRRSLPGGNDFHANTAQAINNRGQVIGMADQTVGGLGEAMWMYDLASNTTRFIGLRDALHTHPTENYQEAYLHVLTDSGLVAGGSVRLGIPTYSAGRTAWLYDFDSDITTPLLFSEGTQGQAQSYVTQITDERIVIGKYLHFTGDDDESVMRPFIGSLDIGFFDLHGLVADGLTPSGWDRLAEDIVHLGRVTFPSGGGQTLAGDGVSLDWDRFAGMGYRLDGSYVPFAVRPVPEPSSLVLVSAGAMGVLFLGWRRRRQAA